MRNPLIASIIGTLLITALLVFPNRFQEASGQGCVLGPTNPTSSGFTQIGGGVVLLGSIVRTDDPSVTDNAGLFCVDPNIATNDVVVTATFNVLSSANPPGGADAGVWFAIGDGDKRVILATAIIDGQIGVGLPASDEIYFRDNFVDPTSGTLRFVPVHFFASTEVTFMRRASDGAGVLLSVNGITANIPEIPHGTQPSADRAGNVVELGSLSISARSVAEFRSFSSSSSIDVSPITLSVAQMQIKPSGAEKVQVRGDFTLDSGSNGIDPASEGVSLQLFQGGTRFYPTSSNSYGEISGFVRTGTGWSINDAEKSRTGIQSFEITETEDPKKFQFNLVDTRTGISQADYSQTKVLIRIGNDEGETSLVLRQQGNDDWVFP